MSHSFVAQLRRTVRVAVCVVLVLVDCPGARAQDTIFAATSVGPRFDGGMHIGPDARTLRYEYADRWRAAVGGEIALIGVEGPAGALALTLGGLLALDNEDDRAPVPYQLLRAVIGLNVRAATVQRTLDPDNRYRLSGELGFTHESDHPSGTSNVASFLSLFVGLDDFSSYEHIRLAATYEHWFQDWLWLSAGAAMRVYTPPINPAGGRRQLLAFEVELRARARIYESLGVFVAFYAEGVGHDLDPATIGLTTLPALFTVVRAEAGLTVATEAIGRLEIYIGVIDEDGRGIDFVVHYGPAFLLGLRASL